MRAFPTPDGLSVFCRDVTERIPGMALANFYDLFPVDRGCTVLIVGDLLGKGLTAASQTATTRSTLRYALYRAQTLSGPPTGLNNLLTE